VLTQGANNCNIFSRLYKQSRVQFTRAATKEGAEIQLKEYWKQLAIKEHDIDILEYNEDFELKLTLLHEIGARE
jgi:hypothetical protein